MKRKLLISVMASFALYWIFFGLAYWERGYFSIGGEVFALLIPLVVYVVCNTREDNK